MESKSRRVSRNRARPKKNAGKVPAVPVPVVPLPLPPAIQDVFSRYWQAIQNRQTEALAHTQHAYVTFLQALQDTWAAPQTNARSEEACRRFVQEVYGINGTADVAESIETVYSSYIEAVRDAWSDPAVTQAIEQAYLNF